MTLKFSKEHEWIRLEGDHGTIGITDYAQQQLGDVVFVELPEVGKEIAKNSEAAVVESVKAASEIYAPVSGTVTEINGVLTDEPHRVNEDPLGEGWFVKIALKDAAELEDLMDEAAYTDFVSGLQ